MLCYGSLNKLLFGERLGRIAVRATTIAAFAEMVMGRYWKSAVTRSTADNRNFYFRVLILNQRIVKAVAMPNYGFLDELLGR